MREAAELRQLMPTPRAVPIVVPNDELPIRRAGHGRGHPIVPEAAKMGLCHLQKLALPRCAAWQYDRRLLDGLNFPEHIRKQRPRVSGAHQEPLDMAPRGIPLLPGWINDSNAVSIRRHDEQGFREQLRRPGHAVSYHDDEKNDRRESSPEKRIREQLRHKPGRA